MSLTPEQPMSRRAAREAARRAATGEIAPLTEDTQPTDPAGAPRQAPIVYGLSPEAPVPTFPASAAPMVAAVPLEASDGSNVPAPSSAEAPPTTGLVGLDGQPLSRRRLRSERETPLAGTAQTAGASSTGPAAPATTGPAPSASAPRAPWAPAEPEPPVQTGAEARAVPQAIAPEQAKAPQPEGDPTGPAHPAWSAPEGHWTRQLAQDDDDALERTASREVGGSPRTTSSILIDHPAVLDLGGPLNATGEVLLTGSIPLSQDFARTGTIGPVGGAEHDDRFDTERVPDAQPVKASAVASQHALGSPIVANAGRRGGRGMTVLLISASVLAVLVTGLVVTAIVLGWFHP